ncbi:MAG: peptide-N-glycosidase F-related protein [Bacteroidia bacterium]
MIKRTTPKNKCIKTLMAFACFIVLGFSAYAGPNDTLNVISHNKVHMNYYGSFDGWGVFPSDTVSFRKVLLNLTIGCPSSGCSQWDYTVKIMVRHNTGIVDSTYKTAPSFTVNGSIKDSVKIKKDTTYTTFYDTITHTTDSTKNGAYTIVQYLNSSQPTTPTDTVHWWNSGYYNYYYNNTGAKTDSIFVNDSIMYQTYYHYYAKYDSIQEYEIARTITPYGGYYNTSWSHLYQIDVSDFVSLLHDSTQIRVYYQGYSDGFAVTCNFEMIKGIPPHKAYKTQNLWSGWFPYGDPVHPIGTYLLPQTVKIDSAESAVGIRVLQTGHGSDNVDPCSEFCSQNSYFKINGTTDFTKTIWRNTCGLNPLLHQAGTWIYDRANWCPGADVYPFSFDLSSFVAPKTTYTLGMDMDPYTRDAGNGNCGYNIGSSVIFYGPANFTVDAEVYDIKAPTTFPAYSRFNPICGIPEVVLRNAGSTPLTSVDINYGVIGGSTQTYHWTGTLNFTDTLTVALPSMNWSSSAPKHIFQASVSNPNGQADQYAANDMMQAPFINPPQYPNIFIVVFETNSAAAEDSYVIRDGNGTVVHSKSGFANNTLYRDTLNLGDGCYQFELDDAGEDGISFFANSDGNGFIRFQKVTTPSTVFNTLQPDFGTSIIQSFTVGGYLSVDNITANKMDYFVYPNPSDGMFYIDGLLASTKVKEVNIYSILGQIIYTTKIPAGVDKFAINTASFAAGMYWVSISNSDGKVLKKLSVVK